jgi:hypothetical protein
MTYNAGEFFDRLQTIEVFNSNEHQELTDKLTSALVSIATSFGARTRKCELEGEEGETWFYSNDIFALSYQWDRLSDDVFVTYSIVRVELCRAGTPEVFNEHFWVERGTCRQGSKLEVCRVGNWLNHVKVLYQKWYEKEQERRKEQATQQEQEHLKRFGRID